MSYKKTRNAVNELVGDELDMANALHPLFGSMHEGYAVTLEEKDEAMEEANELARVMDMMWRSVRADNLSEALDCAALARVHAVSLACEAVQAAAMAEKFINSFYGDKDARATEV